MIMFKFYLLFLVVLLSYNSAANANTVNEDIIDSSKVITLTSGVWLTRLC